MKDFDEYHFPPWWFIISFAIVSGVWVCCTSCRSSKEITLQQQHEVIKQDTAEEITIIKTQAIAPMEVKTTLTVDSLCKLKAPISYRDKNLLLTLSPSHTPEGKPSISINATTDSIPQLVSMQKTIKSSTSSKLQSSSEQQKKSSDKSPWGWCLLLFCGIAIIFYISKNFKSWISPL